NVEDIKKTYSFKKKLVSEAFHNEFNDLESFKELCEKEILMLNEYFLEKENIIPKNKENGNHSMADAIIEILKNDSSVPKREFVELDEVLDYFSKKNSHNAFFLQSLENEEFSEIREFLIYHSIDSYDNDYGYLLEDDDFNKFDYINEKSIVNHNIIKKIIKEDNNQLYNAISQIRKKIRFPEGNDFILYLINYFETLDFSLEDNIDSLKGFLEDGNHDNLANFIDESDFNLETILNELNDILDIWNDDYKEFRQIILKNKDFNWKLILILYYVLLEEESKEEIIPIIKVLIYLGNVIIRFDDNLSFFYLFNEELSTSSKDKIKETYNDTRKFINKWRRYMSKLKKDIKHVKFVLQNINV
ncbi:MAG: hypothetical protein LBU40_00485, partial [Methanobrevibacter sp.]|nr:hypothetical protein [Methanobrevibacter sp.]